ncbi:hypothetical protein SLS56_009156 [Neofusicoccum ribis]|uniref:Apple domain-containing protein n=1 Tax=Neofusicoccum ribis TaxID=45134 RepID=A0ABR3SIZ2_9PEZI
MLFVLILATAGVTAGAAVNAPQITNAPSAPELRYTNSFTNAGGSIQQSFGYRGFTQLTSYDPNQCAAFCDQDDLCRGFNIYVERDPVLRPAYSVCTDPPSTGAISCTRWGYPINIANATNDGSWQASFRVAVAASNGYNRYQNIPDKTLPDFTGPVSIGNAAIQDGSYYQYIDHNDQSAFDPAICAADCQENTAYNKLHSGGGSYTACVSDIAQKATNTGETRGNDVFTIAGSYVYTLTTPDSGQP